jgi:hypothetical protein
MEPFPDLPALQSVLEALASRDLVVYLSPRGQKRGVIVTHGLYPPQEFEKVRLAYANAAAAGDEEERPVRLSAVRSEPSPPAWAAETAALRAQIDAMRESIEALAAEVRDLKTALGA